MASRDHANDAFIIYNKANSPLSQTDDTQLSLQFTEYLVSKLDGWGYKSYYHDRDARAGSNIFYELTRLINSSKYTIVIITREFKTNCWTKYSEMHAFKKLLDKDQPHRLVTISIGIKDDELPENLNTSNPLCFPLEWTISDDHCERCWQRLKETIGRDPVNGTVDRHFHAEEAGDNITRSEQGIPVTHDTEPHKAILDMYQPRLVEDMDAELVLVQLTATQMFQHTTLRDIRLLQIKTDKDLDPIGELCCLLTTLVKASQCSPKLEKMLYECQTAWIWQTQTQTAQNKLIVEMIRRNGWSAYEAFKDSLQRTQHDKLVAALEAEERSLNIVGGAEGEDAGDGLRTVYGRDQATSTSCTRQISETGATLQAQQDSESLPSVGSLYHSVNNRDQDQLGTVIQDLPGAFHAATQPISNSQARHHTTNVSRELESSMAVVSLDVDGPQSINETSMSVPAGPSLSCPPPPKVQPSSETRQTTSVNQSAPVNRSVPVNQSAPLSQSALVNQSGSLSQSDLSSQIGQAAQLDENTVPKEKAMSESADATRLSASPGLAASTNLQVGREANFLSNQATQDSVQSVMNPQGDAPEITVPPNDSAEASRPDSMARAEVVEELTVPANMPGLEQQISLSQDQDLSNDDGATASNRGLQLNRVPSLSLDSLVEERMPSSGYSSLNATPVDGVRQSPDGAEKGGDNRATVTCSNDDIGKSSDKGQLPQLSKKAENDTANVVNSEVRTDMNNSATSISAMPGSKSIRPDQPPSVWSGLFRKFCSLYTQPEVAFSTWGD